MNTCSLAAPARRPSRRPVLSRCAGAFVLLAAWAFSAYGAAPPLTEAALAVARGVRGHYMGVDHGGNLWTWDWDSGRFDLYSPGGEHLGSTRIRQSIAVDADRSWGVAGILDSYTELRVASWEGTAVSIPLRDSAASVAWIDARTVAVAPTTAAHR